MTLDPSELDPRDGPRDECGVFGAYAPGHDVARLAYFALYALQHRGQESAGIASCDRGGAHHDPARRGLVNQVFDEQKLRTLGGELAVGPRPLLDDRAPTRGRTRSPSTARTATSSRSAHNGNLINAVELHSELREQGVHFQSTSDSEIIAALLATTRPRTSRTPSPTSCRASRARTRRS
jgi:amidophosphoribosyltransferase